jgi:hypothetical protein
MNHAVAKTMVFAALGALLSLSLIMGEARACDPSPYGSGNTLWSSGCVVSLTGVPTELKAGDKFKLNFQVKLGGACGGAARLFVSHATPGALESGLQIAKLGAASLYCFGSPQPNPPIPTNDAIVIVTDTNPHTVEFTVDPNLAGDVCISETPNQSYTCTGGSGFGTLVNGPAAVLFNANNGGGGWSHVRMLQLGAAAFKVNKITAAGEKQIVPAGQIALDIELEKTSDAATSGLTVALTDPLLKSDAISASNVPAKTGKFPVQVKAKVADETNADIDAKLLADDNPVPLAKVKVHLAWLQDGKSIATDGKADVVDSKGTTWDITYPDYSKAALFPREKPCPLEPWRFSLRPSTRTRYSTRDPARKCETSCMKTSGGHPSWMP